MDTMRVSVLRIPHGLADPERNVAYIVGSSGPIDCLDLRNGQIAARTDFPALPLTLDQDAIVGWRPVPDESNAILVFAAVRQGNLLRPKWETSLALPEWVEVGSADPSRFTLTGRTEDGLVLVTWEAHARYSDGAPPPMKVEASGTHDRRGIFRLDAETGAKVSEEQTEMSQRPPQDLPTLAPKRRIVPYRWGESWATKPWQAGTAQAYLVRATDKPGVLLVRRNSDGGESNREIRLSNDSAAVAAVTLDGRFVFIYEPGREEPSWDLFSAETGERVASLPFDPGTDEVAVVGDLVLYGLVEENGTTRRRLLRCRNLDSTEVMWSHLLREEALSQPPPLRQ